MENRSLLQRIVIIQEKNLTEKQKEILEDYRLIQYDLVAGNQYSATWATQKIKD